MNINKDINSRNMMNEKMHDFITPNYLNSNNTNINNKNINTFQNKPIIYDKNSSKNDINSRLNDFRNIDNLNLRRLPFNNNIRDYGITVDSKRDEVNDRMSNYNKLSTNMNHTFSNNNSNNYSFHNNFKDENNKRMEELSPLARNLGMPINTTPPKTPDFSQNLENEQRNSINTNKQYNNESGEQYSSIDGGNIGVDNTTGNYSLLNDGINNISKLNYNSLYPCNTRQSYNFTS